MSRLQWLRDTTVTVVGILASVAAILDGPVWLRVATIVALCGIGLWMMKLARLARVLGKVADVIPAYDRDAADFRRIQSAYAYVGVSGATIYSAFEKFQMERLSGHRHISARILLIHPYTEHVLANVRLVNPAAGANLADLESAEIEVMARRYLQLASSNLSMEVRFYSATLRYWAHHLDGREAIIGLRLLGESGRDSTALHLTHGHGAENDILKLFQQEFETLWAAPETVAAADYFAATSASASKAATP